jgi:hypothetical protein
VRPRCSVEIERTHIVGHKCKCPISTVAATLDRVVVQSTRGDTRIKGGDGYDYITSYFKTDATGARINPLAGTLYIDGQEGDDFVDIYLAGVGTVCGLPIGCGMVIDANG